MLLRSDEVEQVIDGDRRVRLVKDVVMTPGPAPLGMVRKRLPGSAAPRGAVLLVHGFGQNRYVWHASRRSFSTYLASEGWDVFNADLRGHGRSRRFGAQPASLLQEYVREDLPACVREAERLSGMDRIFLIGHSMGGIVSYAGAASTLRDEVAGIVSLGAPYRFGKGSVLLRSISSGLRALRATGVFDSNPSLPLRFVGRHFQRRQRLWNTKNLPIPIRPWMPGSIEAEILEEYLPRAFDWTSLSIAFDLVSGGDRSIFEASSGRSDLRMAFEHLNKPLLVIAGSEDDVAPPSSVKPAYEQSRSTDRSYRLFPAGHVDLVLGRNAPITIWPTISRWLSQRESAVHPVEAA